MSKQQKSQPTPITLEVYEPNPEKPDYLRLVRMRTVEEVYEDLKKTLADAGMMDSMDYFSNMLREENVPFPRHRWLACFAVTGGSEGHYIHVEVIIIDETCHCRNPEIFRGKERVPLYLGKTFEGMDRACEIAAYITKVLGA